MFIQQIIIDGFKSYAQRTVIDGFDPHFNAITGLNGSGKSNILDSICFVLGITNLSQVRAGNLSELVYKQGQAGITKASVTIVFDNSDTSNSPVGYEACSEVTVTRQVLLGGKSKYLINGKTAPVGQVTNLFHSVQLNVNNPHFLIMQGRITKVLNMKPPEILGLIEEAAGTRMYETKRVAALKTIEKKQTKLDELNAVLREEITPTLERLRNEKQDYLNWCKNNSDLERAERFCIAADFYRAVQALENSNEGSEDLQQKVLQLEQDAIQYREAVVQQEEELSAVQSKLGGELKNVHSRVKTAEEKQSMELVKVTSTWQNFTSLTKQAQRDLKAAESLVKETQREVETKQTELSSHMVKWEQQKEQATQAETSLTQLTVDYQNMLAGIALSSQEEADGEGNQGLALPDQICQAHNESKAAESKAKQAQMKMDYLKKTLKTLEHDMKKQSKSAEQWNAKRDKAQAKLNDIRSQLERLNFSEPEYESLEKEQRTLTKERVELQDQVETLTAQLESRLAFQYTDPVRGFDRSKVKGSVAKLVQVFQSDHATALEVAAGGKLFQVVVDEAITSQALLQKGQLKRRVTFIPLDKVQTRRVGTNACEQATKMAGELNSKLAVPAIDLIGFDEEVRNAMEYVFGSTLVVDGANAANAICDATKTRTVTLEGDVYDPSGTISGGSRDQLGSTLSSLMVLADAKNRLQAVTTRLNDVQAKLNPLKQNSAKYEDLSGKMELATAELEGIVKHLSQTSYGIVAEKFKELSAELAEAQTESERMTKEQQVKWALYEDLKEREVELTQKRGNKLKEIDESIHQAKMDTADKAERAREAELNCQTLQLELESLKEELAAAELAVEAARKVLNKAVEEETAAKEKLAKVQAIYEEARAELKAVEDKMALCSAELMDMTKEKTDTIKKAEAAELEAKKLSVAISRVQKERKTAEQVIETLQKKHTWIESEKSAFGVPGGDYDFEANNPKDMSRNLETLKDEQTALAKKINKKVMGMIERAEGEYNELMRKRKVVENDKKKIQAVIEELDVKKKSELERTWVKVNGDFGSIFSTLLPGASAKLEPPQGMRAWEGLEVKVAFGDVWKESLSELSGGQRSLLALSLVLSLLLFKPAPMYILDEVDAALDLSHTQNIGNMLKTHFSQSQFIVVSLKEGMFNNANVIFRTKFVDGVSTVTRTIGAGSSRDSHKASHQDDKPRSRGGRARLEAKENGD